MTREEMREQARANVAAWPRPLFTPEQKYRLYVLLAPMRAELTALAAQRAGAGAA